MQPINIFLAMRNSIVSILMFLVCNVVSAATDLADKPLFSSSSVTGNVALALSVEFPTALGSAYTNGVNGNTDNTYDPARSNSLNNKIPDPYLGYFDSDKCYIYNSGDQSINRHYFEPVGTATGHLCNGQWSGNFLNWALTQTIDPFRSVLTGGYRSVDEVGFTLLEKAWASGQGGTVVDKSISGALVSGATPYKWASFNLRINGQGDSFVFSKNPVGSPAYSTAYPEVPDGNANGNLIYRMYARVQVCKNDSLKETNCVAYPIGSSSGKLKPIGLIQKNSMKLNFAAFGYLNDPGLGDDNKNRRIDGGVLRARMAPLGPMKSVPNSPDANNTGQGGSSEWFADTGIFDPNPHPSDANNTLKNVSNNGVKNSGVINYLNKFGSVSKSYKKYDPVSELYYTAIRYYKNQGNVDRYTNMSEYSNAQKIILADGFPVITDWDDPIKYSCQANFIIGVGDTNTHVDGNLPGSVTISTINPATPAPDNSSLNASTATNRVGAIQRDNTDKPLGNIGSVFRTANNSTNLIAGIAYDSHTVDIRPKDFLGLDNKKTRIQTVSTYWLDVLENGKNDVSPENLPKNQYYLAAKFGGFDVPVGFDPYTGPTAPLDPILWDKNGDGDPDNYFRANNPALMITNLNKAFDDILKKISGSSGGFAIPSPSLSNGSMSFSTSYVVGDWTGNVIGNNISVTDSGVTESFAWNAVDQLEIQAAGSTGWTDNRFIATVNCADADTTFGTVNNCIGVPFRLGRVSPLQASNLTFPGATPQNLLDFLRGDRSNAGSAGLAIFRKRNKLLGDIVNSRVLAVGSPNAPYTDAFNVGYAQFKFDKRLRETVAYVGANDGMLHAFRGTPSGGNELFAFVPNAVFAGPNNTPQTDGLAALAKSSYVHRQYVDASPVVQDVFYSGSWHSLLVSGLGKGGKSYFAIDVTNPSTLSNEDSLASAVKWEFKHKYMGYTYGNPVMVKTAKHGWVVILTSGYNNEDGKGYFFIINPQTGELLEPPISTGEGSVANPAGLAHANAYVSDFRSYVSDAVYAGDLLGNVWRLDLTSRGSFPAPIKIATLSSGGLPQPVTTAPLIQIDPATSKRYVFIGTGKLLADSDIKNTQQQTFYAINDGTANAVYTTATLPAGSDGYPVTRNDLIDNTTSLTGVDINADPSKPMGYFIDLGFGGNGIAYRVNIPMVSGAGVVAFAANLTGGDECNPSGSNKFYALYYGTGATALSTSTLVNGVMVKQAVKSINGAGLAVSIKASVPDTTGSTPGASYTICDAEGNCKTYTIDPASGAGFTSMNWRELPSAD